MTDQDNANLFKKWCAGYSGCDGGGWLIGGKNESN